MARRENLAFLDSVCPPTVKDRSYDALLTWLFGTEERTITTCARIAYQSMKRKSRELIKMPKQDAQAHYNEVVGLIFQCIHDLCNSELSQQEAFDSWHKSTCERMIEISSKHNPSITFGLAQYWLNLTVRNMLLMEIWDEKFEPIRQYLHISIDTFIIEKASSNFGIEIINIFGQFKLYSAVDSKPWQKWDYSEYIKFQEDMRNTVEYPMEWEYSMWSKAKTE